MTAAGLSAFLSLSKYGRWVAEHFAVEYDIPRVHRAFRSSGLLEEGAGFARAILSSIETGEAVAWFFVQHVLSIARDEGWEDLKAIPDGLWQRAIDTFDWERWERK
jgi:hypothetical protein